MECKGACPQVQLVLKLGPFDSSWKENRCLWGWCKIRFCGGIWLAETEFSGCDNAMQDAVAQTLFGRSFFGTARMGGMQIRCRSARPTCQMPNAPCRTPLKSGLSLDPRPWCDWAPTIKRKIIFGRRQG